MKKYSKETIVGVFVVIGLALIGYMTVKLGNVGFLGGDAYTLDARFTKVNGLRVGSPVILLGLEIGRVESLSIDQKDLLAVASLRIRRDIVVYDDAVATIRTEGLIGDKLVEIDPGGAGEPLKEGDTIVDTQAPADIMELISKYAFGNVEKE